MSALRLFPVVLSRRNGRLSALFLLSFHFQLFGYLTVAAASLLIVLRMYVILCNSAMRPSIANVYRQHRHMEQEEVRDSDRGWRMGG